MFYGCRASIAASTEHVRRALTFRRTRTLRAVERIGRPAEGRPHAERIGVSPGRTSRQLDDADRCCRRIAFR